MTTWLKHDPDVAAWFGGRLPDGWFTGPIEVVADRDEIVVTGTLPMPELDDSTGDDGKRTAALARIQSFREDTRDARMRVAHDAEVRFERKVSWGARCGAVQVVFTNASVPVMTRLRLNERGVLDTLIDAGVARSRSEALAWCVRLVGRHQGEWIGQLREALGHVDSVREAGPDRT